VVVVLKLFFLLRASNLSAIKLRVLVVSQRRRYKHYFLYFLL